jgi:alkylation response protein AidB-like acyl-CoA dehydrogenase
MDLNNSEHTVALQKRLRELIASEAPQIHLRNGTRVVEDPEEWKAWKAWSARLYELQFAGRSWPVEYGGVADSNPIDEYTIAVEIAAARAPPPLYFATYAAHAIINFGTEEQKRGFLWRTRASDIVWCQLFSEPQAGSDLGALRTRAERRDDVYVINGQKVWNTQAQKADYGFLLARTSKEGSKHAGITAFLVNMRQPGVVVRPIREITGSEDFNEVFFTDAVVPASHRIGEEGEGWKVAMSTLAKERINAASYGAATRNAMNDLLKIAKARTAEYGALPEGYRHKLVNLHAACRISDLLGLMLATRVQSGNPRVEDPLIAKMFFSETNLAVATFAMELLARDGIYAEGDTRAIENGRWADMFLYARTYAIAGGSSEVIRNVLSERVLAMPREE